MLFYQYMFEKKKKCCWRSNWPAFWGGKNAKLSTDGIRQILEKKEGLFRTLTRKFLGRFWSPQLDKKSVDLRHEDDGKAWVNSDL